MPIPTHEPCLVCTFVTALLQIGHPGIPVQPAKAWQLSPPSLNQTEAGIGLLIGSLGILLGVLWSRTKRLQNLLKQAEEQIDTLLIADPLTQLINRKQLYQIGQNQIKAQPQTDIALIYLNLDQFKAINDELGHEVGDLLLQQIAKRLKGCVGASDTLARIGGDEFALLLVPSNQRRAEQIAQTVLAAIAQPIAVGRHTIQVQGSVGISLSQTALARVKLAKVERHYWTHRGLFNQLLLQADIAMVQAKRSQSRYAFFHPSMQRKLRLQVQRKKSLKQAIEQEELRIRYQPIVDLHSGKTVGFEALVRWQHPQYGLLSPHEFLPLAEEMDLVITIDRWMLRQACMQLRQWQHKNLFPTVSVNLSASHLVQADLTCHIASLLQCYSIEPSQLNLEITESVMITNPQQVVKTLKQLREIGLRVSLDDFGTGYSSLGYLNQLPVDVLKIDRSFVRYLGQRKSSISEVTMASEKLSKKTPVEGTTVSASLEATTEQDEVIVRMILALAEGLNIRVIAEGIERGDQLDQLKEMHCRYGQGNFFSKPLDGLYAHELLTSCEAY